VFHNDPVMVFDLQRYAGEVFDRNITKPRAGLALPGHRLSDKAFDPVLLFLPLFPLLSFSSRFPRLVVFMPPA
jgi:hypothetical protein